MKNVNSVYKSSGIDIFTIAVCSILNALNRYPRQVGNKNTLVCLALVYTIHNRGPEVGVRIGWSFQSYGYVNNT